VIYFLKINKTGLNNICACPIANRINDKIIDNTDIITIGVIGSILLIITVDICTLNKYNIATINAANNRVIPIVITGLSKKLDRNLDNVFSCV